jgi:hypothetical protein
MLIVGPFWLWPSGCSRARRSGDLLDGQVGKRVNSWGSYPDFGVKRRLTLSFTAMVASTAVGVISSLVRTNGLLSTGAALSTGELDTKGSGGRSLGLAGSSDRNVSHGPIPCDRSYL